MEAERISNKISQNCKVQEYLKQIQMSESVKQSISGNLKLKRRSLDRNYRKKKMMTPFGKRQKFFINAEDNKYKWEQFLVKYTTYYFLSNCKSNRLEKFQTNRLST